MKLASAPLTRVHFTASAKPGFLSHILPVRQEEGDPRALSLGSRQHGFTVRRQRQDSHTLPGKAGSRSFATAYLQLPVDLLDKTPGLLQIIGAHQFPFHDGEGHLGAWSEVKVFDSGQGDGRTSFVFQTLKLHQLHGRDGLGREGEGGRERESQFEWEEQMCQTSLGSWSPQFTARGFRTTEGSQSQPESTRLVFSSGRRNAFDHLKSTDDELRSCLASSAAEPLPSSATLVPESFQPGVTLGCAHPSTLTRLPLVTSRRKVQSICPGQS